MIAAVLVEIGKPLEIIADIVSQPLRDGQVKVKMIYSGLCRSQLMEIDGFRGEDKFLPHLLGHEGVGIVLEIGKLVTRVKPKDQVVLSWIRGEGLSEPGAIYKSKKGVLNSGPVVTLCSEATVSESRVYKLDHEVPLPVAAILGCAVATGAGVAVNFQNEIRDKIALVNGLGGVGINTLLMAKNFNPKLIIASDIDRNKLNVAQQLGFTNLVDLTTIDLKSQVDKLTYGAGIDIAFDSSGSIAGIENAFNVLNKNGLLVFSSHPKYGEFMKIDPFELINGKKILGSWGGGLPFEETLKTVLPFYLKNLLNLDSLISDVFPLSRVNEAIELMRLGKILRPIISIE